MCRNHNRTGIKVSFDFKNAFFQNLENVTKIRQNPYLFDNLKIRKCNFVTVWVVGTCEKDLDTLQRNLTNTLVTSISRYFLGKHEKPLVLKVSNTYKILLSCFSYLFATFPRFDGKSIFKCEAFLVACTFLIFTDTAKALNLVHKLNASCVN